MSAAVLAILTPSPWEIAEILFKIPMWTLYFNLIKLGFICRKYLDYKMDLIKIFSTCVLILKSESFLHTISFLTKKTFNGPPVNGFEKHRVNTCQIQ